MGKGRAPCCDKKQVKRGPWSPAEDLRLITFIQNHGHDNWRALPKQSGLLRCGKSCRLRWINYLRPDVKRGNFTLNEEETIIELHKTWGNKWSKIASRLPGRTDNEIKNVWNTHLKKRLLPMTKAFERSDDEPKESRTTSSSSSSNENQNLENEPLNKTNSINNNLFCSEQQATSSLSTDTSNSNSSNSSSQVDTFWPQNHFDFGEEVNKTKENHDHMRSGSGSGSGSGSESESPSNNMGIKVPLESDVEFWDMLDLDNIDLFEYDELYQNDCHGSNFVTENNRAEFENEKWFKYLENELGLDRSSEDYCGGPGADEATVADRLLDMDSCLTYFADEFT